MKKKIIILLLVFGWQQGIWAQDIHFSQIQRMPVLLSPAMTGSAGESYVNRLQIGHREQWRTVVDGIPYRTHFLTYDRRFCSQDNFWGLGAMFYYDQVGEPALEKLNASIMGAFHKNVADAGYLSIGIQGDWTQYQIGKESLFFESQFIGSGFDLGVPSQEVFRDGLRQQFWDLSVGIQFYSEDLLTVNRNSSLGFQAGIALFHLLKHPLSFLEDAPEEINRIPPRLTANLAITIPIGNDSDWKMVPRSVYSTQQLWGDYQHWELLLGADWQWKKDRSAISLIPGLHSRWSGKEEKGAQLDALIPSVLLRWSNLELGISYDWTISSLRVANNYRGGIELLMGIRFEEGADCKYCPVF